MAQSSPSHSSQMGRVRVRASTGENPTHGARGGGHSAGRRLRSVDVEAAAQGPGTFSAQGRVNREPHRGGSNQGGVGAMARILFFTFDGGGNHPPTIGIATELKQRGRAVTVAGYESQRRRFEEAELSFVTLPRSGSFVQAVGVTELEMRMALARGVIANPDHLVEVPELAKGHDAMVVDSGLHMALAAAAALAQPPIPGPAKESLDEALFDGSDHRPLVLVGLTTHTAYGPQTDRLQRILDALSQLPVRVVATAGVAVDMAAVRVPANAVVRDYLPHRALMPEAAVCVTHLGHGTLTEALLQGVPLVCLPNPMSDQIYLAQRVTTLGAGVQIDQDSAPATIREAVQTVLSTSSYREAAVALKTRIGKGGAGRAADVLEAMLPVKVVPARR